MSQNESFIDEVTEELRRDRLFALFRRWAWLAVLLILLVVGLAAWNEWQKARRASAAQALGDGIAAALETPDPAAALGAVAAEGEGRALLDLMTAAETADSGAAAAALEAEAGREASERRWRDLAALKLVLLQAETLPPEERIARLEPLTSSDGPYRLIALEQTAYARIALGERDVALAILREIVADGAVTEALRLRASQMIVALGGSLEPA